MSSTNVLFGLGYVGLPLAVEFARRHRVIGLDIDTTKVAELQRGHDRMREVAEADLRAVSIDYTSDPARLREAEFIIVCVPTPIDKHNNPDLTLVCEASRMVGQNLAAGSTVIYESTVYPGVTEDICLPILTQESGLQCPRDFAIGYSPDFCVSEVAEHTVMLMLACQRKLLQQNRILADPSGRWTRRTQDLKPIFRLSGKTVGIIGLGSIGSTVYPSAGTQVTFSPNSIKDRPVFSISFSLKMAS